MTHNPKILQRDQLEALSTELAETGKTLVTTNGCFDILHVGHIRALKQARSLGDVLVVGLNSDESVRKLKGSERPLNCEEDRAELLAALECVDYVTIFGEDTPCEFLKIMRPKIHAKSADYKPENLAETPVVESGGGKVVIMELIPGRSTTNLVEKIKGSGG